ncbi:right-handed parallel beta-helix repeat-containing protein [Eubacteriaceae bacterium ES2]|nr:right-handed parallel beta-helix repeat-containing protein [Eubacteriaceae bacterium ES2]
MKKLSALLIAFVLLFSTMPVEAAKKVNPNKKVPVVVEEPVTDTTTPDTTTDTNTPDTTTNTTTDTNTPDTTTDTTTDTSTPDTTTDTTTDIIQGVSVKDFGAVGNGATNDTAAIQAALNASSVVNIPDGTYMINVDQAIKPNSGQTINLSSGAVLKALPSTNSYYSVIRISGVSGVTINGGTIVGERYEHLGSGGEWGMGIHVIKGASSVNINGVTVQDCWGDGIFLGDSPTVSNIVIDNVIAENNRRQGISITDATGVTIKNSIFRNTNGTLPEAGIDIEPDAGQTSRDIEIINVQSYGNNGSGLDLMGITGPISEVSVSSSDFSNNDGIGIRLVNSSAVTFTDVVSNNNVYGVEIERDVNTASFDGLTVSNNRYRGVSLVTSGQTVGSENIIFKNSVFSNNSQSQPGSSEGIRVDAWDQSGYIKSVSFQGCQFIDTQSSKTQSYGLTVGFNSKVSSVTYDSSCVFSGNINGSFIADSSILKLA